MWYKQVMMVPLVYNIGADSEQNEIDMIPGRILEKRVRKVSFGEVFFFNEIKDFFYCLLRDSCLNINSTYFL